LIYSDEWRSYKCLSKSGSRFVHQTVNHSRSYVNPIDYTHTNTIEGTWNKAKMKLKQMVGVDRRHLQYYLDEFMWRQIYAPQRKNAYIKVLNVIRDHFHVNRQTNDKQKIEQEDDGDDEEDEEDGDDVEEQENDEVENEADEQEVNVERENDEEQDPETEKILSQSFHELDISKDENHYNLRKRMRFSYKI
jgi:transposase-like protein